MDEAEPICDAVDMNVHTNGRKVESDGDGEVGGFASDAWEFAELFDGVRYGSQTYVYRRPLKFR